MKLSTRLSLGMALLVLVTSAVIGLVAYRALERTIYPAQLSRMAFDTRSVGQGLASAIDEAMANVAVNVDALAVGEFLRARATGDGAAEAAWRDRLTRLYAANLKAEPSYLQMRFIGLEDGGREIVRVERAAAGGPIRVVPERSLQAKGERPYFIETAKLPPGGLYVSRIELNREFGQVETPHVPVLRAGAPVYGPDGRLAGIFMINVDLRPAFAHLRASVPGDVQAYVVNAAGDYLVNPDRSREFGFDLGAPARLQDDFPMLAEAVHPGQGNLELTRTIKAEDGSEYGVAVTGVRLPGDHWVAVILMAPRSVVLVPADRVLFSTAGIGLAAIAVAVVLAALLSGTIVRPLDQVTRAIGRFDRGEPVQLPARAMREIGVLVDAFRRHIEREHLYNAVVQGSTDAILTKTLDGRITAWNAAAEGIYGYTAEEAIGQPVRMLVPDDRAEEFDDIQAQLRAGEPIAPLETVRLSKAGQRLHVSLSVSPVRSLTGEVTGASEMSRDIGERKRMDALFRLAVEASPAAMFMIGRDGRILLANERMQEMFGYGPKELIGRQVETLMPERFRGHHAELRAEFATKSSRRMMGAGRELYGLRRDGTEFPVEIGLNPSGEAEGSPVLSVVVDITQRKQAAEQSELLKSQFLANMSHELRTPLNAIIGYSELILKHVRCDIEPDRQRSYIEHIHDGGQHLLSLINDLLDLSRVENGKLELHPEDFDLNAIAREAVDLVNAQSRAKQITLSVASESDEMWVNADRRLVKQVLLNLMSNAVKFTPNGGSVAVGLDRDDHGDMRIVVRDDGIGMPKDKIAVAFDAFVQIADPYSREANTGAGLGLALCKRFVELHKGRIRIDSELGAGTTVTVVLPANRAMALDSSGTVAVIDGSPARQSRAGSARRIS